MRNLSISAVLAAVGLFYGFLLCGLGFATAGAGHGTYVIVGVSSSPFGLTQNISLTLFAAPALWCAVGASLGWVNHQAPRALFLALMLAHYAALPMILGKGSSFGDWAYVSKVQGSVTFAFVVYGVGQLVFWAAFVWGMTRARHSGS